MKTYRKQIMLSVRKWDGSAYVLQDERDITAELKEISSIKWKLDWESYGLWNASNCTIALRNDHNRFREGIGYLAGGGILHGAQVRVLGGESGETLTTLFTGTITADPVYDMAARTVTVTVCGFTEQFSDVSAENLSILVENEQHAGAFTDMTTSGTGVGIIDSVKRGATALGVSGAKVLSSSSDYSTANLNTKDSGATITPAEALSSEESLWVTYRRWHQDKTIEWLADGLCTVAGITKKRISPAVFANDVCSTFSQADADDFADDTLYRAADSDGNIVIADGFPAALSSGWTINEDDPGNLEITASGVSGLSITQADMWHSAYAAQPLAFGTWQFATTPYELSDGKMLVYCVSDSQNRAEANGYALELTLANANTAVIRVYRSDAGALTKMGESKVPLCFESSKTTVRVSRDENGVFRAWALNQNRGWFGFGEICTDLKYKTSSYMLAALHRRGYFYSFCADAQAATGCGGYNPLATCTSPEIDATASLVKWGTLRASQERPQDTATTIYWRQRAAQTDDWGAWTAVPDDGTVTADKRYLQLKWEGRSGQSHYYTPSLLQWALDYYTSTVTVPLANMSGLNALSAQEELAALCAYEVGFDGEGYFLFRPRTGGAAAPVEIDDSQIVEITSLTDGCDRVKNVVRATYGDYYAEATSRTLGMTRPDTIDRLGQKVLEVRSGNLLAADNANLAQAVAPTVCAYTAAARRRTTLTTPFMSGITLGTRVKVLAGQKEVTRLWKWGDPAAAYSGAGLSFYTTDTASAKLLLYGTLMRVEGIEYDLENWQCTLNLTEEI